MSGETLEKVAARDAVWLQDSPTNLMVINSVISTDKLSVERLRQVFTERILMAAGGTRYPRFKKRIVNRGRKFYWQEDLGFDISRHIFEVHDPTLTVKETLQTYIGEQASQPLPWDRPLWQIQVIPNFGDGGTALITRIHHVMGDGISLVPVIFEIVDSEDGASPFDVQVKTRGTAGDLWKVFAAASLIGGPFLAARALSPADNGLFHGQYLSGRKRVAWTPPLDLQVVKELKNRAGGTVNDVLMSCVAGAFRRYHERHPDLKLRRVRVSMPVNIRPPQEVPRMENKFAAVMFDLPVEIADPKARLEETKRRMNALKRSVEPMIYYGAVNVLVRILPFSWSRALIDFYAQKCTAVLSNVPGPQSAPSIGGSRMRAMLFWVPQRANIGLGISILSFAGEVRIGVFADDEIVADPADLVRAVEQELEHLRQVL